MLNKLNEVVKSKISDENIVKDVMEVAEQYELTHKEDFIIKCFGIAYLFYNKIKYTLKNFTLTDHKGLWRIVIYFDRYNHKEGRLKKEHEVVILHNADSLSKLFAYVLNIAKTDVNTEFEFCPCVERKDQFNDIVYNIYSDLCVYYKLILKEEDYSKLPQCINNVEKDKHLSVGDGITATACVGGMLGLMAAPLLFI